MPKEFKMNMNKKVTFTDAKVGDRVWSLTEGWGTVRNRLSPYTHYPLAVMFDNGAYRTYTLWGRLYIDDLNPTLFWDEVKIEAPEKPLPQLEVDAKVLVWVGLERKYKRHFSHFRDGEIHVFDAGQSSWTGECTTGWDNWEVAE